MKFYVLGFAALFAAGISARAQKIVYDDNVEKRPVSSFHAIEASSGVEVVAANAGREELGVSVGNTAYLDEVKTVVERGVLKIYRSSDNQRWDKWKHWKVKVYVSYVSLDAISVNSGAMFNCSDLKQEAVAIHMNSGGRLALGGSVRSLDVNGSSGAQMNAYDLSATYCKASLSSGAGVRVTVEKEVSARANSGGSVRFRGPGLIRDISVNSGGSVKRD